MSKKFNYEQVNEYVKAAVLYHIPNPNMALGLYGESVEDIVQDILVKVISKEHLYNPEIAKVNTWVSRIAFNTISDLYKKRAKFSYCSIDDVNSNNISVAEDNLYDRNYTYGKLRNFDSSLGETDHMILDLLAKGYRNKDIAAECNLSESAATTRIFRLRTRLMDYSPCLQVPAKRCQRA